MVWRIAAAGIHKKTRLTERRVLENRDEQITRRNTS